MTFISLSEVQNVFSRVAETGKNLYHCFMK